MIDYKAMLPQLEGGQDYPPGGNDDPRVQTDDEKIPSWYVLPLQCWHKRVTGRWKEAGLVLWWFQSKESNDDNRTRRTPPILSSSTKHVFFAHWRWEASTYKYSADWHHVVDDKYFFYNHVC